MSHPLFKTFYVAKQLDNIEYLKSKGVNLSQVIQDAIDRKAQELRKKE